MQAASRIATLTLEDGSHVAVIRERTPCKSFGRRFLVMFDDTLARIARTIRSGPTLRVMIALTELLDFHSWRRVAQAKLGEELGISQSAVSSCLRELLATGVIERRGGGPVVEWRLSPSFGWRGTAEQYHKAQRERAKDATRRPAPPPKVAEWELWK